MKKSILVFGLASLFIFSACQQFKTGEGGLQYKIVKDAGNPKPEVGDLLSISLIIKSDRDSVLTDTYEIGLPQIINIMPDSLPGMYPGDYNTMFKMLGEGDSAVFKIDLDTLQAKTGQEKPEFADKYFVFEVKANKLFKKGDLTDSVFYEEVNTYFDAQIEKLKDAEEKKIADYVSKNNLDTEVTESGLQYVFTEKGTGAIPQATDTIVVNYTGYLVNGKLFDTSVQADAEKGNVFNPMRTYEPARFVIGVGQVISGWDEGLLLTPMGSKIKLIIPSEMAYGQQGDMRGDIPPYAPLIFDIELLEIIPSAETPDGATQ